MSTLLNEKQRGILFYVFIVAFTVITALTIWGVFFGLDNFEEGYKQALFSSLIIELVGVVIVLFRSGFVREKKDMAQKKIWIDFGEEEDVRKYIGKDILISPRGDDGNPLGEEIINKILNDRGLYVSPALPFETMSVFITLETDNHIFEGSFSAQSYSVKLEGEEQ